MKHLHFTLHFFQVITVDVFRKAVERNNLPTDSPHFSTRETAEQKLEVLRKTVQGFKTV